MKVTKNRSDWSQILFVKHPHLFLPMFSSEKGKTNREVQGLHSIFYKFAVQKRSRILDLSCGIGRHAIMLAKHGYQVTGYDPSPFFLSIAKQTAAKKKSSFLYPIHFYEGKPGRVSQTLLRNSEKNFDVIINMWQSFGYSQTQDDIKIFRDVRKVATGDCLLIVDAQNRDWTIRNFQPHIIYSFGKKEIHETWKFNLESSILENVSKFYEKDQNNDLHLRLNLPTTMKMYSLDALKDVLERAGWKYINSYGSITSLKPVSLESKRIVAICKLI